MAPDQNQPVPPTQPEQPPMQPVQPVAAQPMQPTAPAQFQPTPQQPAAWPQQQIPAKKKSLLWLWITLGVVLLTIIGLVVAYFVMKSSADSAASTYMSSVKTYAKDVADKASSSTGDPADAKKAIEGLTVPKLQSAVMGESLSSSYKAAMAVNSELTSKVKTLTDKLSEYSGVYEYHSGYKDLLIKDQKASDDLNAASAAKDRVKYIAAMTDRQNLLKQFQTLIDEAKLPSELSSAQSGVSAATKDLSSKWTDVITAFKAVNSTAYNNAYDGYVSAISEEANSLRAIKTYYDDLSSKVSSAASDFQTYADSIK